MFCYMKMYTINSIKKQISDREISFKDDYQVSNAVVKLESSSMFRLIMGITIH